MRSNVRMQLNGAGGLAAIVGLQFMVAPAAMAQTSDTAGNGAAGVETEEVVVTAQRRKERLQDVPIAISALGADTLAERGVDDVSALRGSVPGLSISNFGGVNVSNLVAIRGVSGQPLPIGAGQATAMYIDGVYLSRPDAGFFALDDVERLEVLRGPQGTLYGRNATAGAINIITREPGQQRRGGFDLSYGNFASVRAKGSLNGGLTDRLSAGISASYDRRDGYFVNTVT
ncbi:MAG: TonB-dependent receptor plug domain-containing protein, partial [Gammaproteobacteria bacterium]|nr:TonB-dependent receptor plug domain-containing protein [Gammaproteobacteria bacterium]